MRLDLVTAMVIWDELGTFITTDDERGYRVGFINKAGEEVGHTLAKGGFYWEYPQELVDEVQKANELNYSSASDYAMYLRRQGASN